MNSTVSVILPTYYEAANLEVLLFRIHSAEKTKVLSGLIIETIIVDDNSQDLTTELRERLVSKYPNTKIFIRKEERGLATAIKQGILESTGDIIVIMDADLSHEPRYIPIFLNEFYTNDRDIIVGSRFTNGGILESTPLHILSSKLLNKFINTVLQLDIHDATGGYLLIKRECLADLCLDDVFQGYGDYCISFLYQMRRYNRNIKEIGIHYKPRINGESKTKFLKSGLSYGIKTIKLRWFRKSG